MDERIGFTIYQSCGNSEVFDVCPCFGGGGMGGVGGEWAWTRDCKGGVVLCLCEL